MESKTVDLSFIGTKAKSKAELYRLLTVEGMLYLPPQEYTTMSFISDICFNEKKVCLINNWLLYLISLGSICK